MVSRPTRPVVALAAALSVALSLIATDPRPVRAQDDPRTAAAFLQGLRDLGYHDLAGEYLERLRARTDTPAALRESIDFEIGRTWLDEASKTGDLVRRKELLERARARLDAFTREQANHPRANEALVQLARLLVERGSLALMQADETGDRGEKDARLSEARASFGQARTAYDAAVKALDAAYEKFPRFLVETDPRHAERDRIQAALMDAQLQKGVVDYEDGQTHPAGSKERTELMGRALAGFEDLYKRHRTQFAGLAARMWQAKCYEERGELGPAIGIYNELLEHADPRLRPLQRHVAYFKIIALGKRKEHALAADEAARWLRANDSPELLRSKEGLGVQLELARDIAAQLPSIRNESDRAAAVKRVIDTLGSVVRYSSPFKAEALELLAKYKPSAAANAAEVSRLNYEDAVSQGEQAMATHEWERAEALLQQGVRRAEAAGDVDKTNHARYDLAYVYYMDKRYYQAAVLASHLARRYPRAGLAAKAAEIGMAALAEAYNTHVEIDRASDLDRLVDLARYAAATFPDLDQGDTARLTLGQVYHGTGRYPQAIEAYESVRPNSSRRVEARTKAGASHWQFSQALRAAGKTAEADAEVTRALAVLDEALQARRAGGASNGDAGLVENVCDLADIHLETGKPAEALKLLDPVAKAAAGGPGPATTRLNATRLRAHVATSQVDLAMADMAALEKAGGGAGMAQLYYNLGKLLEKEMDALRKKGDAAGLDRTRQAYLKFLSALAASKSGQTYDSLEWAGENMLDLGNAKEAEAVFRRVLADLDQPDAKPTPKPLAPEQRLRTRLRLAAALRAQAKHDEDKRILDALETEFPRSIEVIMARALSIEAMARTGALEKDPLYLNAAKAAKSKVSLWSLAYAQWRNTALRLGNVRTKPLEYYEAWYHAALALKEDGRAKEARQALAGIMRLSRSVGGPEMKQRYEALLEQLK